MIRNSYDISNVLLNNGGCHFVNFDKYGFWYYSNGRILNFGKDYKLKKEYCLSKNCEGHKIKGVYNEVSEIYDDGEFIWVVFNAEPDRVYGIEKATGKKLNYNIHHSVSGAAKEIGIDARVIIFWPILWLLPAQ